MRRAYQTKPNQVERGVPPRRPGGRVDRGRKNGLRGGQGGHSEQQERPEEPPARDQGLRGLQRARRGLASSDRREGRGGTFQR